MSEIWNSMSEEAKKPYVELSEQDKQRHAKEMKEYETTGFFTNAEGVNSKTLEPIKAKVKKGSAAVQ